MLNVGSMGRDIQPPPGSFILGWWFNTFYGFGFSRIPGNVYFFSGEYPSLKNVFSGGWVAEKHIIFGKMEFIDLAKVVIGTPCNAYISEYFRSSIFQPFYGLQWSSAQNTPEYF